MRSPSFLVPVGALAMLLAACQTDQAPTTGPDLAISAGHLHPGKGSGAVNARNGAEMGTTGGWAGGREVTFFYNKPYVCQQPPAALSTSGCEAGAEPESAPRGGPIPVLYVMTPLGFRPDDATLQCPEVGNCINHPSTLDLTRVFGAGAEDVPLPAHSHIVELTDDGANAGWWEIEVVGVTTPEAWDVLVAEKSLAAVRRLQAEENSALTGDIPSNLYLFFGVRK